MHRIFSFFTPLFLILSSCDSGDSPDPATVAEFEENKLQIEELEQKLKEKQRQLESSRITDPTPELEDLKEAIEQERNRKEKMEKEISDLQKEKVKATEKLSDYKEKYPLQ